MLSALPLLFYNSPLARLGLAAESPIRVGPAAPLSSTRISTTRRCYVADCSERFHAA
jgi:hypothetical protein